MYTNLECIILRTVSHNERSSIVTAYSRQLGRFSFLTPAGNTREARRRRALLLPLSLINCVADIRNTHELVTVKDITRPATYDFSNNPLKSITALFLADFLNSTLKETQPDDMLFSFLTEAMSRLGNISGGTAIANFHIAFLVVLQRHLGIAPDFSTYRRGRVFDMIDGVCRPSPPLHGKYLGKQETEFANLFSRINLHNMHLYRLNREQRNRALDVILEFYSIHLGNIHNLQSLEVVRSLF